MEDGDYFLTGGLGGAGGNLQATKLLWEEPAKLLGETIPIANSTIKLSNSERVRFISYP